MDIKIKIKKCGLLENVEIELAPFMIFTGKSNLGKSYTNYLVYYLMWYLLDTSLGEFFTNFVVNSESDKMKLSSDVIEEALNKGVEPFMRKFLGDENFTCDVEYSLPKKSYVITRKMITVQPTSKKYWVADITLENGQELGTAEINGIHDRQLPGTIIAWDLLGMHLERVIMLPPGKCAISGSTYSLKSAVASGMKMYDDFLRDYDYNRQLYGLEEQKNEEADRIFQTLLKGDLITEKDKEFLEIDSHRIPLSAAASSIKELSSLLFYIKNHYNDLAAICLEEPESHLHPELQISIADVISVCLNHGMIFNITTHSDYFLQRINQLIKLGDLKNRDEKVYKEICEEYDMYDRCFIDRNSVKAYYFYKDDKGKVVVEDTKLNANGIQYKSFSDAVNILERMENSISDRYYSMEE